MNTALIVSGVVTQVWVGGRQAWEPDPSSGDLVETAEAVSAGMLWDGEAFSNPPVDPSALPPVITYPADVWRRCTNEEANTLYAAMDTQSAKLRGIWNTSQEINHADDLYSTLRDFIKTALGSADYTRADELLAASE